MGPPDMSGAHDTSDVPDMVLHDICVPRALLSDPVAFGGTRAGDVLRGDLQIVNGRARRMTAAPAGPAPRLLLPALVEAHCHLDKCHSLHRMGHVGGDLSQAIAAQKEDKVNWTADDLYQRMGKGLAELASAGCRAVRSHIDWGLEPEPPLAWTVLNEMARDHPLTLQTAALTSIDQLAEEDFCTKAAMSISQTQGGVLGAFVLHHDPDKIRRGLRHAFSAAERFGLPLDFHVDEGLGAYNGLEAICDAALATRFQGPILCGHAVSLADRHGDDLERVTDKLLAAGVYVCALPTTNLYLQGRRAGTPNRRGITRLRELDKAGVPVVLASDNVADAFCPVGQHDPRAALHLGVLAAHLDPPMGHWLRTITRNAAAALGLAAPCIEAAPLEDLRLCDVPSTGACVASHTPLYPLPLSSEAFEL